MSERNKKTVQPLFGTRDERAGQLHIDAPPLLLLYRPEQLTALADGLKEILHLCQQLDVGMPDGAAGASTVMEGTAEPDPRREQDVDPAVRLAANVEEV